MSTPKPDKLKRTRIRRLMARAQLLKHELGLTYTDPISQFSFIEHTVHELAHVLVLGFSQFPQNLSTLVNDIQAKFSEATRDSMEIDTAFVTLRVLIALGLVAETKDAMYGVADACANALDGVKHFRRVYSVMDEMECRANENSSALREHAALLTRVMTDEKSGITQFFLTPEG